MNEYELFLFQVLQRSKQTRTELKTRRTEHVNLNCLLSVESLHLHHLHLLRYVVPQVDVQ